jgi:ATP-binding cassette subfamily B protein
VTASTSTSATNPAPSAAEAPKTAPKTQRALDEFHEEAALPGLRDGRLLLGLWPYLRPHSRWLWLGIVTILLTSGLALLRPLIMLRTIDEGIATGKLDVMMRGGALFAGVAVCEQLIQFVQVYSVQVLGARSLADLRSRAFEFLCSLRVGFFDRQPVGRLVTRVTNDIDAVQELFASGALNALGDLVRLVGIVALMLTLDVKLALIAFAAMPFIALLVRRVRRHARQAFRDIRNKTARMNANMNEQVNGMSVIQAFGRQEAMGSEFDQINAAYRDANIRAIKYDAIQDAAIDAVSAISLASIIVALGYHSVSFGVVVAFSAYLTQFFEPIAMLAQRYTLLQSALSGAERLFQLFAVDAPDAPVREQGSHGDTGLAVEFERVSFAYKPGVEVLKGVNLQARPGEKIALVGPTGSGKSTITSLVLRLYDVEEGTVRVGGRDVRTLSREELRAQFSVVPQDVFLFPGTVAENIAAGGVPDQAAVRAVLERLGVLDVFLRRDGGLDAPVLGQGSNFSAGERQLIAFARALYRDAPLLILDEATASIDSDTESRLQVALGRLLEGRTAIVVAHRLSTIRAADRILVLQKGRVVEQGSHAELVAHKGLYAALYELQFARQAVPTAAAGVEPSGAPAAP